jgi:hypothetical protein
MVSIRHICLILGTAGLLAAADQPTLDKTVQPVLSKTCTPCHNEKLASGGLNITGFTKAASVMEDRAGWERILDKVRSGEMPPKGVPRPPQLDAVVQYLQGEFEKADHNTKPDPGRVTARRLNRAEYTNTIRDLLGVEFRAEKSFPTDDLGNGFDNIGDVLTISPVLMEKYLSSAGRIAARAIGADPLPKKPIEIQFHYKDKRVRRVDPSTIEAVGRIEFDGDYDVRIGLPGERGADAKPVQLGFWVDGKLVHTQSAETKPSGLVYFNPYSDEQFRLTLTEGEHVFRAGFINDDFVKVEGLTGKDIYSPKKNKYLESITFTGPFASKTEKASRKKILVCDPNSGAACVEKILTSLAHNAYRRPVTRPEVASLMKFVTMAKAEGQTTEQGLQLAIQAMLVSPNFLFRMERDPNPTDPTLIHPISDVELASRLSYFLWSSMPDAELLGLAEAGKLRPVLDAQVKRMLADERSSAIADNFAGQWLELRNLDVVKPDPQKFPEWDPELRDAMKMETRLFFDHILRDNRPLGEFLDARYTYLNERLANFYGIPGVKGPDFRRVELTTDQRGGLLSQASVLTVSSYPTRTSVVIRGKYILQNILNSPPPPPPPDVPLLDEKSVGTSASLRQQMEKHRADPMCASCHNKMDPLGFGLENYDGIGKWRTQDGKFPVDSSGTLPNGKTFNNPAEMRALLKSQLPEFARCMVEKMLTYSLGRGLGAYDRRTTDEIGRKWAESGYPFQSLIFEVVHSLPFQSRRGEMSTSQNVAKPKEIAHR